MRLIPVVAFALLAACASAPEEQDFTLSVTAPALPLRELPEVSIAVGAARVPDLYDRPQLVVRATENRVRLLEQERWAEPLKSAIPRVVAGDLARLLATPHVMSYPAAEAKGTAYRVALDVQRFDAVTGQGAAVDVEWRVSRMQDGAVREGRTTAQEPGGGDYEALVAAQSRALATVSRDIAQAIVTLHGP